MYATNLSFEVYKNYLSGNDMKKIYLIMYLLYDCSNLILLPVSNLVERYIEEGKWFKIMECFVLTFTNSLSANSSK